MTHTKIPKIAIVGRPNVGKSSLFNRLVGLRRAIVDPTSGTTRDRMHATVTRKGKSFMLIDTGGYEAMRPGDIARLVLQQLKMAIAEADVILFVTDSTSGIMPVERELAIQLRKASKKTYLVVNKVDNPVTEDRALEFYELGFGRPYAVSATTKTGIDVLLEDIFSGIPEAANAPEPKTRPITVAIIGRPNVGKSSYINAILKEERVLVNETAGTTRDAIDIDFNYNGREFLLIDTAGMRHKTKLSEAADFYSSVRSKEAVQRADVAVVLIDGFDGLREDDIRIITTAMEDGKGVVILVNKCDMISQEAMRQYKMMLLSKLSAIKNIPVIFISCRTGQNIDSSLEITESIYSRSKTFLKPNELKRILDVLRNTSAIRNKEITISHVKQLSVSPPKFHIRVRASREVPDNVKRQIENTIRSVRNYEGVPIRLEVERPKKAVRAMRDMRRLHTVFLWITLSIFSVGTATADIVELKNGGKIEGVVVRSNDKIVELSVGFGSMTLPRDQINRVVTVSPDDNIVLRHAWEVKRSEIDARGEEYALAREKRFEEYGKWSEEEARKRDRRGAGKDIVVTKSDDGRSMLVDVVINETIATKMILDTGASIVILNNSFAEKLGVDISERARDVIQVRVADGRNVLARMVMLKSVKVGDDEVRDVVAAILIEGKTANVGGLLGMSFLKYFNFHINYSSMRMSLEKIEN